MDYERPELIATYVEDELVAEAAVSTTYCVVVVEL
jgi:hypothetical protein